MALRFVPRDVVLLIHKDLLNRYGGRPGVRDAALLQSALAQSEASFGGEYLHKTLFDKAAAYGFHLCKNHPFVDGNKRVALVVMDVFLQRNGIEITASEQETYALMIQLANGDIAKADLARWLKENSSKLKK